MSKPRILVAQFGARKHYQEPALLHQWGVLESLYTDFYMKNNQVAKLLRNNKVYSRLPKILKKGLDRYELALEGARIIQFPWFGYKYAQSLRKASSMQEISSLRLTLGREFCKRVIQAGLGDSNTIYGFSGASLELFKHAKTLGIRCILDQIIAERSLLHRLLMEENSYYSDWPLLPFVLTSDDLELVERERHEQELADHIICGSDFVKNSLIARGVKSEKISVISLGCVKNDMSTLIDPAKEAVSQQEDVLKILFVGSVGLRKGIPYLIEALQQLYKKIPFVCKIVGSLEIKPERIAEYKNICSFLGQLPRSQMKELYSWADVFVLPSICEGSAMVSYEALDSGLPVITTYNSGSIVRDGVDGFIVPIRDAVAIKNKLLDIYQKKNHGRNAFDYKQYLEQVHTSSESTFRKVIFEL